MSSSAPKPLTSSLLVRLVIPFAVLLFFAGDLLASYFSFDDFMNLHQYVEAGWQQCRGIAIFWSSHYYRPLGGLVYLVLYQVFGLHPLAFKCFVLVLLLVNLYLALILARLLLHSVALASLVALLIAYQSAEAQLYYSFGTIYELLCFLCMFAALLLYVRRRERGSYPGWGLVALIMVLEILALDAKEMAVAVPVLLALYEALLSPAARKRTYSWRSAVCPVVLSVIAATYIHGKSSGGGSLMISSLYRPVYSLHQYVLSMSHYLNLLFHFEDLFHSNRTILFLAAGLILGAVLRSRVLLFGWLWTLFCFLPLNFIPHRSGFVWYIPLFGLALAFVALCEAMYQRLARRSDVRWALFNPESVSFFAALAFVVFFIHLETKPQAKYMETRQLTLDRQVAADLEQESPKPAPHARLLFLNDPFPIASWTAEFMPALQRRDLSLGATRGKLNDLAMSPGILPGYTEIYDYQEPHLIRLSPRDVQARLAASKATHGFVEAVSGVDFDPSSSWARRVFSLRAGCPRTLSQCQLVVQIVLPHEAYPGVQVHKLAIQVDNGPVQSAVLSTDVGSNSIATILAGRAREHTVTYQFDTSIPKSQHPLDSRPDLAVVLRGATIMP